MRVLWRWSSFCLGSVMLCWSCEAGRSAPLPSSARSTESVPAVAAASKQTAEEGTPFAEQVLHSFFPYQEGPPRITGITPGAALSRGKPPRLAQVKLVTRFS